MLCAIILKISLNTLHLHRRVPSHSVKKKKEKKNEVTLVSLIVCNQSG